MVILSAKFQPNRYGNKKLTRILKSSLNGIHVCRIAQPPDKSNLITPTPYMVLPLFATRFAAYAGGIRDSLIQPRLF